MLTEVADIRVVDNQGITAGMTMPSKNFPVFAKGYQKIFPFTLSEKVSTICKRGICNWGVFLSFGSYQDVQFY